VVGWVENYIEKIQEEYGGVEKGRLSSQSMRWWPRSGAAAALIVGVALPCASFGYAATNTHVHSWIRRQIQIRGHRYRYKAAASFCGRQIELKLKLNLKLRPKTRSQC